MSAAIITKYLGPTDFRGSRIVATADIPDPVTGRDPMRVTVPYPYDVSMGIDAHRVAATALIERAGWAGPEDHWIGGHLANGQYVFTRCDGHCGHDQEA